MLLKAGSHFKNTAKHFPSSVIHIFNNSPRQVKPWSILHANCKSKAIFLRHNWKKPKTQHALMACVTSVHFLHIRFRMKYTPGWSIQPRFSFVRVAGLSMVDRHGTRMWTGRGASLYHWPFASYFFPWQSSGTCTGLICRLKKALKQQPCHSSLVTFCLNPPKINLQVAPQNINQASPKSAPTPPHNMAFFWL